MKKLAILFFGAFAFSTSAQAITWDFAAEGDRVEDGYAQFITGVTGAGDVPPTALPTGITIKAYEGTPTAVGFIQGDRISPYMDAQSPLNSGREGGLGACGDFEYGVDFRTGDCGSDDNQVYGEQIKMEFDSKTHISSMVLTGDHANIRKDTKLHILSDLDGYSVYDIGQNDLAPFEDFLTLLVLNISADNLRYWVTGDWIDADQKWRETDARIYLVSMIGQVPVPAAVWLFGTAMLGLFGLRRKTKAEALAA